MEEIDIWRAAQLLLKQHGADAELAAARQMDAAIEKGDPAGESVWKRVLRAIEELRRASPRGRTKPH